MKKNPLDIEPGTIFITGMYKTTTGQNDEAFGSIEKKMLAKGYKVFNPFKCSPPLNALERVSFMVMCDKVCTLTDWNQDPEAFREVQIARNLNKEIFISESFEKWDAQKKAVATDAAQ